jgi:hypothetical protein
MGKIRLSGWWIVGLRKTASLQKPPNNKMLGDNIQTSELFIDFRTSDNAALDFRRSFFFRLNFGDRQLRYFSGVEKRDYGDSISVGNDDISRANGNSATGDNGADFTRAIFVTAVRTQSSRVNWKCKSLNRLNIAHRPIDDYALDAHLQRTGCEESAERRVRYVPLGVNHENIAWKRE